VKKLARPLLALVGIRLWNGPIVIKRNRLVEPRMWSNVWSAGQIGAPQQRCDSLQQYHSDETAVVLEKTRANFSVQSGLQTKRGTGHGMSFVGTHF
jgi:hypothetical protein